MRQFTGIMRYEFIMSIRRWGMWLAFGFIFLLYVSRTVIELSQGLPPMTQPDVWQYAGKMAIEFNLFMPVAAGIVAADRMVRDVQLDMIELQRSTPMGRRPYVMGKFVGVLLSLLAPQCLFLMLMAIVVSLAGVPFAVVPYTLAAFLIIGLPAYAFLTVFSLALPLFMPLRVYQVLFTGYWVWGNYLDPQVFPTISNTVLAPCGVYAYEAFFGGALGSRAPSHTPLDAALNLIVLIVCTVAALYVLQWHLGRQARRA